MLATSTDPYAASPVPYHTYTLLYHLLFQYKNELIDHPTQEAAEKFCYAFDLYLKTQIYALELYKENLINSQNAVTKGFVNRVRGISDNYDEIEYINYLIEQITTVRCHEHRDDVVVDDYNVFDVLWDNWYTEAHNPTQSFGFITVEAEVIYETTEFCRQFFQYPVISVPNNPTLEKFLGESVTDEILNLREKSPMTDINLYEMFGERFLDEVWGNYDVRRISDSLVLFSVLYVNLPSQANGDRTQSASFLVDVDNMQVLSLPELFDVEYYIARNKLDDLISEWVRNQPDAEYLEFSTIENYQPLGFSFDADGLEILIDSYTIGWGGYGPVLLSFTWEEVGLPLIHSVVDITLRSLELKVFSFSHSQLRLQ